MGATLLGAAQKLEVTDGEDCIVVPPSERAADERAPPTMVNPRVLEQASITMGDPSMSVAKFSASRRPSCSLKAAKAAGLQDLRKARLPSASAAQGS